MDLKDFKDLAPTRQAVSFLDGFKAFAFKGNVIDLAVGVIIGGAFGNIVKSLVDNLLMPVIGIVLPGKDGFEGWVLTIKGATIPYGKFLGDVVNFLILAFVLYLFIARFMGWMMAAREQEATKIPPMTKDQELLAEIRDALRQQPRSHPEG